MNRLVHFALIAALCAILIGSPIGDAADADDKTNSVGNAARSLGDLTGSWQLFVDDYLIAESTNLERTYHAFDKHPGNPVAPIVGWMPGGRGTVLPQEDGTGWIRFATGRATVSSPELIHWGDRRSAKPAAAGSGVSVMHTPWDQGREYKMVTYQHESGSLFSTFHGYYSRDGISAWTPVKTNPLMHARADTPLRPSGRIRIDDQLVQVETEGELIDAGKDVEIILVEGNRVVVKEIQKA